MRRSLYGVNFLFVMVSQALAPFSSSSSLKQSCIHSDVNWQALSPFTCTIATVNARLLWYELSHDCCIYCTIATYDSNAVVAVLEEVIFKPPSTKSIWESHVLGHIITFLQKGGKDVFTACYNQRPCLWWNCHFSYPNLCHRSSCHRIFTITVGEDPTLLVLLGSFILLTPLGDVSLLESARLQGQMYDCYTVLLDCYYQCTIAIHTESVACPACRGSPE